MNGGSLMHTSEKNFGIVRVGTNFWLKIGNFFLDYDEISVRRGTEQSEIGVFLVILVHFGA